MLTIETVQLETKHASSVGYIGEINQFYIYTNGEDPRNTEDNLAINTHFMKYHEVEDSGIQLKKNDLIFTYLHEDQFFKVAKHDSQNQYISTTCGKMFRESHCHLVINTTLLSEKNYQFPSKELEKIVKKFNKREIKRIKRFEKKRINKLNN